MSDALHERAGELPRADDLVDVRALEAAYRAPPDVAPDLLPVSFGTSGHRGTPLDGTFNEAHVLAVVQAIADYRAAHDIRGRLLLGHDTHLLSELAYPAAIEVLCANGVDVVVQTGGAHVPTPVLSHAILAANRRGAAGMSSDGIVLTPSHNPPEDGGIKYNPPHGGPAGPDATTWIQERANAILRGGMRDVARAAAVAPRAEDLVGAYVDDLGAVIDLEAVASAGLRIAVDAIGGAAIVLWPRVAERYGLALSVHNGHADPTFSFVRLDWDGRVRMDCSSPFAMRSLAELARDADLAVATDTDADRHGIALAGGALMQPNRFLAVSADYLLEQRAWSPDRVVAIGKTVVTTSLLDRIADARGRALVEAPTGFKWFADALAAGRLGFAGEESAGAAFLRRDGGTWTTDKDGIAPCLLAAEILARTGHDLSHHSAELDRRYGAHVSGRIDRKATPESKQALARMEPRHVGARMLAGFPIERVLTRAPSNGEPIGGIKIETRGGWFAIRPSGTENTIKVYAESFDGADHLARIQDDAREITARAMDAVESR